MPEPVYHIPALLTETIQGLAIRPNGVYVDVTFGGGGHSRAIMAQLGAEGRLFSFDQDIEAYQNASLAPSLPSGTVQPALANDNRWQFVHGNFRYLKNFMRYYGIERIDGLLADLGVSFHHFDSPDRGFSFRFDSPLDMRMNPSAVRTAADVLHTAEEAVLADIFRLYGELKNARSIAAAICKARQTEPLATTGQLAALLSPFCGRDSEKRDLARVFQALRIEVNDEMGALREMLVAAEQLLAPEGRIAVLTYHSLEDRIVKNFLRTGNLEGVLRKDFYGNSLSPFRLVNNKVLTASDEEVADNPRARSAKLRIACKQ